MKKVLNYYVKSVYGKDLNYPACEDSKTLASLLNAKTFTQNQMKEIEKLGYKWVQILWIWKWQKEKSQT